MNGHPSLCQYPELMLISLLDGGRRLQSDESIMAQGAKRYSKVGGYARSATFERSLYDLPAAGVGQGGGPPSTPRTVIVMNATNFSNRSLDQFAEESKLREAHKAFSAFQSCGGHTVATGRWGCGAYKGDVRLKLLAQWIAASAAGVNLTWYNYGVGDREAIESLIQR